MRNAIKKIEGIGVYLAPQPLITVLDVKYLHLRGEDGTDLYVTECGLPFAKCLMPENHWADSAWMKAHGVRLRGTSAVHRVRTKEVEGRSKEIVIKWNRMGQDIPGETRALDAANAEFNSPFMEFSLVFELRNSRFDSPWRLHTHKPLAIYVPRKYVKAEQLGRRQHKMEAINRTLTEIDIDWNRNYAVIYEWLKGVDAVDANRAGWLDKEALAGLTQACGGRSHPEGVRSQRQQATAHYRAAPRRTDRSGETGKPRSSTGWSTSNCCGGRPSGKSGCGRPSGTTTSCGKPTGLNPATSFHPG